MSGSAIYGNMQTGNQAMHEKRIIAAANRIVRRTGQNHTVYFSDNDKGIDTLEDLDELVFQHRPDLILHLTHSGMLSAEEMLRITQLKHVKKLDLCCCANVSFKPLSRMKTLTCLRLWGRSPGLDISFIEGLDALDTLHVSGRIRTLAPIAHCRKLKTLYLSTNIKDFAFIKQLDEIETLTIDSCVAPHDFGFLNKPGLKILRLVGIKMLENVDSLSDFQYLEALQLCAKRIKKLPDMRALCRLRYLALQGLKQWENPEVLQTIPSLEKLNLEEINTKLKAEAFYFLVNLHTLQALDIEFIDVNKGRIKKMKDWFIAHHKAHLLKRTFSQQIGF
jgi:hypothetical protein